jgi:uncharacterized protein (DUF1697 family)
MRYVGLVRNVMLGREGLHRDVLLRLVDDAGGRSAESHLTTGNLTFEAAPAQLDAVVRRLEDGIAEVIGRHEPVVVRTAAWIRDLVAGDPFAAFPADWWELAVAFLALRAAPLDPAAVPRIDGLEAVAVRPHELLIAGLRDVRRPGATYLLPRPWRDEATTRSWSTVQRLAAVSSGGRRRHRTTSIGAMPSSTGRSKPHTCA